MSFLKEIKYKFSGLFGSKRSASNVAQTKQLTSELAAMILSISDFQNMRDEDIYEQLFIWDTDAGGSTDRISSLVSMAFNKIVIKDDDEILDDTEKQMLKDSNSIFEESNMKGTIEASSDLLLTQGNVFGTENKDLSFSFFPNKYCSLVEKSSDIGGGSTQKLILQPNILVVNEESSSELDQKTYAKDKFFHIKYKDTPIFMNDVMSRKTFGIYSISPMHRTVLPIWWKRQMMVTDILWRYRNVPREHHKIDSEAFIGSGNFIGTPSEKNAQRNSEFSEVLSKYADNIKNQTPEQGFVTSDAIDIDIIESKTKYTEPNRLLEQLRGDVYTGMNIPSSVVDGSGTGSYASELVVSNYVSAKIIHIASRIKPYILSNMRKRLLLINSNYPVEKLDFKLNLTLTESNLDLFRIITLAADSGLFTEPELRNMANYIPIPDNKRDLIVNPAIRGSVDKEEKNETNKDIDGLDKKNIVSGGGTTENPDYPETPQSESQHDRDASENVLNVNKQKA